MIFLLGIAPLACVAIVFAQIGEALRRDVSPGRTLGDLLLVLGLFGPWLAAAVAQPLYASIGDDKAPGKVARTVLETLARLLPALAGGAALTALLLAVVVGWPSEFMLRVSGGLMAYALLAALLVHAHVVHARGLWLSAWLIYATCLAAAPSWWLLPPTAAAIVVASRMLLEARASPSRATGLKPRQPYRGIGEGFLLGSVFWADKALMFLLAPALTHGGAVFLALIPSTVVFTFHYARTGPRLADAVEATMASLYRDPVAVYVEIRAAGRRRLARSACELALVGSAATVVTAEVYAADFPGGVTMLVLVATSAVSGAIATIAVHALLRLLRRGEAFGSALVQLAALAVVAVFCRTPQTLVAGFTVVALLHACLAAMLARRAWRTPEYEAFWRRQIGW